VPLLIFDCTAIAPPNASLRRHHRTTCVKGPGEVMVTAVCVFSSQSCNVAHKQFGFAARFYTLIYFSIMCTNNNSVKARSAQKPAAPSPAPASIGEQGLACLEGCSGTPSLLLSCCAGLMVAIVIYLTIDKGNNSYGAFASQSLGSNPCTGSKET
jgi:hypothetical protein